MSDTSIVEPRAPLGVGAIISESFSILFKNLVPIAVICIVPIILSFIASGAMLGFDVILGGAEPDFLNMGTGLIVAYVANTILSLVIYGLLIAMLVQLAYDAKLGRPLN